MIRVALAKGRLLESFINYLEAEQLFLLSNGLKHRQRQLLVTIDGIDFIIVKGSDVPIYVEQGIADIGIVGSDILNENKYNINNLCDLPFGHCHFSLAAKPVTNDYKKIATSYVQTTSRYFKNKGIDIEIVKLSGSIELACIVGMVDGIIDIVQTGTTLKANGLVEKEKIADISARLITNRTQYFKKGEEIESFINMLGVQMINA
ncbi:ATP phosphoribosyltransferase [Staphylococcus pasteuri]|uniref:ATP phosphoribosyltransferase n=1 Tax=Staphylococcus pasteuri TaxID=45972 RepID=UPI001E649AB1|nr:ATP phosphoribosyltransferase [Staphylococcus pasteuri]MCD9065723.1 ATP phosphoribosyltransferase [Staphylococcus pasteuri]